IAREGSNLTIPKTLQPRSQLGADLMGFALRLLLLPPLGVQLVAVSFCAAQGLMRRLPVFRKVARDALSVCAARHGIPITPAYSPRPLDHFRGVTKMVLLGLALRLLHLWWWRAVGGLLLCCPLRVEGCANALAGDGDGSRWCGPLNSIKETLFADKKNISGALPIVEI